MSTADKVLAALQPYQVKPDGKDRYRCNSPLRPGSNSHAFSITIDDAEHGAYHDFVSGDSGSLYDLAKLLHIDLPERIAVATTKRGYTGLDDYARAHGIPYEALKQAKWGEVMKYCGSHKKDRLALEIPTRTGKRWRLLDGLKPYYVSPPGYQRCWYGLTASTLAKLAEGKPLILCNGEISTVAGQFFGVQAVCVTAGENVIPPELLDELKAALGQVKPRVLIALDCDKKGEDTARKLCSQLKAAGFDARAVDLGLGHGGDLADFVMLHRYDSSDLIQKLSTLPEAQTDNSAHSHWRIVHANDLKNLPKTTWLIDKEIPERGLTAIFGPSGVGKSFLSLHYALTIAQKKPVVYVVGEGDSGYLVRQNAWSMHNGLPFGQLHYSLGSPNMMDDSDVSMFIGEIEALSPALIVVDTLAMAMVGGDENSSRDMGKVISVCQQLKRELNTSVVLVHHTSKAGVIERGSSALRGASDTMIRVTADDDLIVIESSKTKDAEPFPTRHMKLLPVVTVDGESRVLVTAELLPQAVTDPLTRNQELVLKTMALEVFQDGVAISNLVDMTGLSYGSLGRVLSRLIAFGFAEQPSRREPYVITEAGRLRINDSLDSVDSVDSVSHTTAGGAVGKTSESCESCESTESLSRTLFPLDSVDSPRHQYAGGL